VFKLVLRARYDKLLVNDFCNVPNRNDNHRLEVRVYIIVILGVHVHETNWSINSLYDLRSKYLTLVGIAKTKKKPRGATK